MLAAIPMPSVDTLPASPLLIHPEPEDMPYFVRPGTPVPRQPVGPLPVAMPGVPGSAAAQGIIATQRPVVFGQVKTPFYKQPVFWIGIGVLGASTYLFLRR